MVQRRDGRIVLSPTDLAEFLTSRFASWMSRGALDHPAWKPGRDTADPEALLDTGEILKRRGFEHEARELAKLEAAGLDVVVFAPNEADAHARTLAAMRAGRAVIAQAHLAGDHFAGIADFLVRVPGASRLGDFHYEVHDAKLARHPKPTHLLQLCCYADLLEQVQGVRPAHVELVLGDGSRRRFRTDDFFYFYRSLRDAFIAFIETWDEAAPPLPDASAEHGRWQDAADRYLEACDHPSRVAFCTGVQTRKLAVAGIPTATALATTALPHVAGLDARVFARLREQAGLQRASAGRDTPLHRVLETGEVETGKGFAMLPPASPGDVCFDLEGDPLEVGGLEYLWGVTYCDENGALVYHDWWAHDRAEERLALERFLDWLTERRQRWPDLHVHHYGSYETAVLKRLASREGTREDALDVLLRGQVFVDLYGIVRNGLRVGEPRYSLKNIERLYRGARAGDVTSGMQSVVVYDAWRHAGEPKDWRKAPLLRQIRDYNEQDCRSTAELLAWLHARQAEAAIAFAPAPAPSAELREEPTPGQAFREELRALSESMLAAIPAAKDERARDARRWYLQELLAHLVLHHYREMRPVYWELHAHADATIEDRFEAPDCLADLRRTDRARFPIKHSWGYEYAFDPAQDTKIQRGDPCRIAQHRFVEVEVDTIDPSAGRLVLKITPNRLAAAELAQLPDTLCLIRFEQWTTRSIEESIRDAARRFHETQALEPALEDLLLRQVPRIRGHAGGPIQRVGETSNDALLRALRGLDAASLCVQGPPGSGKTTKSAAAICALVREGRRVGVTSNSHKAIENLLRAVAEQSGGAIASVKIGGDEEDARAIAGCHFEKETKNAAGWLGRVSLIGGTAWCFCRPELAGRLDYLFVDEASQVSLAKVVAMSRAARNLVLVGDQMQLAQPIRAQHPGDSGRSALDHALADVVTIPPERGIFLAQTYRLHPEICSFVSGAFYEDRLQPDAGNRRRSVQGVEAGLHFVPVEHAGNTQGSDEEVLAIERLVRDCLGRTFHDSDGSQRPIPLDDILVVAPYNLQVRKLEAKLPQGIRIGSVDRFQGLQAPIVIVSMCASEAQHSPRGIGFLLHPNRLNVAVSRAQCAAFVVGSPRLATAACRSVDEMQLVNRICRIVGAKPGGRTPARRAE